jgi:hypothetical protein
MLSKLLTAAICIALSNSLFATSTATQNKVYKKWHDACLNAKVDHIDTQIAKFEAQLRKAPTDYLAQAYLGSCHALRAKAGIWPPSRLSDLSKSKTLMDGSVAKAPNDPRVRAVRAIASYKVPKRFNRRGIALSDFKKLIPVASGTSSSLLDNERQAILYYAYLTYSEEGKAEAIKLKASCHKIAPNSKYGKLTR